MINKEPGNVEQAREPGHYEYEMQRFNVGIQQLLGFYNLHPNGSDAILPKFGVKIRYFCIH